MRELATSMRMKYLIISILQFRYLYFVFFVCPLMILRFTTDYYCLIYPKKKKKKKINTMFGIWTLD